MISRNLYLNIIVRVLILLLLSLLLSYFALVIPSLRISIIIACPSVDRHFKSDFVFKFNEQKDQVFFRFGQK